MTIKWLLVLLVITLSFSCTPALKSVSIAKCCNVNEFLTSDSKCLKNDSSSWNLTIYGKGKFLTYVNKLPLTWKLKESVRPICDRPIIRDLAGKNNIPFLNGSLYSLEFHGIMVQPDKYCIDYKFMIFCLDDRYTDPARFTSVHVKKCCGENGIFSETNSSCIYLKDDSSYRIDIGVEKTLGEGFPVCAGNSVIAGKFHEWDLLGNGSLMQMKSHVLLAAGNFCLEHILENAGRSPSIFTCQQHLPVLIEPVAAVEYDLRFTLYPIALAISVIFLVATLAAGSLLPASHHVLHWRCQTNHVACLLVGNVLLCITQLSRNMEFVPCFMIALAMHFLFLAAFFWLNTMCFNIWWTFRDLRPQSTEKNQERLRLRLYEAYAWGIPLTIALIAAIFDVVPENPEYEFLRPKFAKNKCWFQGDMEMLTFFYGPIGTLLVINLLLFGLTARELTCGLWKRELVKSTTERAALGRICMKLVVVMGVTWVADVISWAAGGPHELWYVTDIINCLQGVFIFIVVGCQPQVLAAVKRAWCLRKHRQNGTAGTTNHHSSSSQGMPSMGDTLTNTNSVANNTTKSIPLETSC